MIGTIRKHSQTLWWVIIVVVIITFVYWGASTSGNGGGPGRARDFGEINGQKIGQQEFYDAGREVLLSYFFSTGEWPDGGRKSAGFDETREVYFRLLLTQKMDEMGIHPSDEAVARTASDRLRMLNRGNPVSLDDFAKSILSRKNLTIEDFHRYIRHDVGVQQLASLASLGGNLVTPQEVRSLYEREYREISAQAVFFSASNHLAEIPVTDGVVTNFFELQSARYRLPERAQVNYVRFAASNYLDEARSQLAQVTNLEALIEAEYQARGSNFFREAKSPAEAKEQIRETALNEAALVGARKAARLFAAELFDRTPAAPEQLVALAKEKGLVALVSPPFDREEPPAGLDVRSDFMRAAFKLSAEEPYSDALMGGDGVYVITLNRKLPSEIPEFAGIRDRVTQDYRFFEAVKRARLAGQAFHARATNVLAAGKGFSTACGEAGVRSVLPAPFSISSRSIEAIEGRVNLSQFKQAAFSTEPGRVSNFTPTADGGFVVFVQSQLPLDEARMKADLGEFTRAVRQARRNEAFNDWFRREAEKGFSKVPYFHQQQTQLSGGPAR